MRQTCIRHAGIIQVQACERLQLGDGLKPGLAYPCPNKLQHPQRSKAFQALQSLVRKAAVAERQLDQPGHFPKVDQSFVTNVRSGQIQVSEFLQAFEFGDPVVRDVRMAQRYVLQIREQGQLFQSRVCNRCPGQIHVRQ